MITKHGVIPAKAGIQFVLTKRDSGDFGLGEANALKKAQKKGKFREIERTAKLDFKPFPAYS